MYVCMCVLFYLLSLVIHTIVNVWCRQVQKLNRINSDRQCRSDQPRSTPRDARNRCRSKAQLAFNFKRRGQPRVPFSMLTNFDSRYPQLVLRPFIGYAGRLFLGFAWYRFTEQRVRQKAVERLNYFHALLYISNEIQLYLLVVPQGIPRENPLKHV